LELLSYARNATSCLSSSLAGLGIAPEVYEGFKRTVVAQLPDTWRLAAEDIEKFARCWPLSATASLKKADAAIQKSPARTPDSERLESVSA
jgi:hypothetical protein